MTLSCVLLIQPDFIIVIYELCHLFNFCYNNNHVHTTRTLIIGKEILNMENRSTQEEELETLQAIYGADFQLHSQDPCVYSASVATPDGSQRLWLQITCPKGYPSSCPPVYELRGSEWLKDEDVLKIAKQFTEIHKDNEGELVVYQWIECVRDFIASAHVSLEEEREVTQESDLPSKGKVSQSPHSSGLHSPPSSPLLQSRTACGDSRGEDLVVERGECPVITHGESLTDRKSTFQAHAAVISSKEEVKVVVAELKKNRKIASATHNIMAYRLLDAAKGEVVVQDCDDDGETAAGSRLLHLLQMMNAMNVVVVVSRWYGGILLHGDRFKHINNVARTLLQDTGVGLQRKEMGQTKPAGRKGKRTKHS